MAEENANTPVEKPTSIDKPKITINPITGLPFGGATINPETNTIYAVGVFLKNVSKGSDRTVAHPSTTPSLISALDNNFISPLYN